MPPNKALIPGLRVVEEHLRHPEPETRAAALTVLTRSAQAGEAPRGTGDALAWALADDHEDVRHAVVRETVARP